MLYAARRALRWGYKRCEDICWIKTNQQHKSRKYLIPTYQQEGSMLVHTKVGRGRRLGVCVAGAACVTTPKSSVVGVAPLAALAHITLQANSLLG